MLQRAFGQLGAANHPGNLLGTLGACDFADTCLGSLPGPLLFDQVMMIRKCCDLRKMGDAKYLARPSQRLHLLPDSFRCAAPDPGVNFDEDECARGSGSLLV